MLKLAISEILYLFSAFHGVFLATLLLVNKKSIRTNLYLSLLILLFSFYLVENVIFSSGYLRRFPHLFLATLPLIFLIGPLFYFYIKSNIRPGFKWSLKDFIHLAPFIVEFLILLPFYLLDATVKLKIYEASFHNTRPGEFNIYFFGYLIYFVSTFWYFLQSFRLLSEVDTAGNFKNKLKRQWLRRSSMVFFTYILLSLMMTIISTFKPSVRSSFFHVNLILQTLLIHVIGYVAFLYPDLFKEAEIGPTKKYQFSSLDDKIMADLKIKLTSLLEEKQPYLDCDVTPDYFLDKLGISRHHFSQLLTEGMQTNFYDLINSYRIEKAKKLLLSSEYEHAKILHVAYDCGFSNKSSFLRNFKKLTGSTPTEYRTK